MVRPTRARFGGGARLSRRCELRLQRLLYRGGRVALRCQLAGRLRNQALLLPPQPVLVRLAQQTGRRPGA